MAGLRANVLYRNNGDGTFTDATAKAGLAARDPDYGTLWAVGAAFFDYDKDGWLDLFVSNYCVWDPATEPICNRPEAPDYCHPDGYKGLPNSLFRNNGDGTFTDVSVATGIRAHVGKGMGIGLADFDEDGWPDVFVSNDNEPAFLFHNQKGRRFEEVALAAGVAYTEIGKEISGMGADARDFDNDGRPDIFQTALDGETMPLFRNRGGMAFEDWTGPAGLVAPTLANTGWSNGIVDFNNDGWKDLFVAGGGVVHPKGDFAERAPRASTVYVNLKNGKFVDASAGAGAAFASRKAVHRGAAFGDLDDDGRVDAVVERPRGAARDLAQRQPGAEPLAARAGPSGRRATVTASAPGSASPPRRGRRRATSTRRSATAAPRTAGSISGSGRTPSSRSCGSSGRAGSSRRSGTCPPTGSSPSARTKQALLPKKPP